MENVQSIVLGWPALMKFETASQYLSLDSRTFEKVTSRYSIYPVIVEQEETRWRKTDLDKLIRRLPRDSTFGSLDSNERILSLDENSLKVLGSVISDQLDSAKSQKVSRLVSINETAELMGVGRSSVYRLIESGSLTKVKIGRRTLIERSSIYLLLKQ